MDVFELTIAPGFLTSAIFLVQGLLDRQVLDHDLDDPVDVGKLFEVVLDVAGLDQLHGAFAHEGCGIRLRRFGQRSLRKAVSVGGAIRDDVEQKYGNTGIGDLGGDA